MAQMVGKVSKVILVSKALKVTMAHKAYQAIQAQMESRVMTAR